MGSLCFGEKLKTLINLEKIPQAELLRSVPTNRTSLHRFFTGKTDMRSNALLPLLERVGIDVDEMLTQAIEVKLHGEQKAPDRLGDNIEALLCEMDSLQRQTILDTIKSEAKNLKSNKAKVGLKRLEVNEEDLTRAKSIIENFD